MRILILIMIAIIGLQASPEFYTSYPKTVPKYKKEYNDIYTNCRNEWGDFLYKQIVSCTTKQTEAFNYLERVPDSYTKRYCTDKWGTNYKKTADCVKKHNK